MRQVDETKIPDRIRIERNTRRDQKIILGQALHEENARYAELVSITDKIEQSGNISKILKHHDAFENSRVRIEILKNRVDTVSKLSAAANDAFLKALEETHPCCGCKLIRQELGRKYCVFGWENGAKPVLVEEVKDCPDPTGRDYDKKLPLIFRQSKPLPQADMG